MQNMPVNKILPSSPFGLLEPTAPPLAVWEDIFMNFIVGLPAYQGNSVIMMVMDYFSKAAHFGDLPTNFSSCKAVELFTKIICKLHGYPKSIILDCKPFFFLVIPGILYFN